MSDIYQQHDKAFANVAAYVLVDGIGNRVATVAFKFPRDGAGRLWCYLHVVGLEMVRGHARGFGYDKRSAAIEAAAKRLPDAIPPMPPSRDFMRAAHETAQAIRAALAGDSGADWRDRIERGRTLDKPTGLKVWQAC